MWLKANYLIFLATNTALTAVDNEITEDSKYITTPEFNELSAENFTARIKQANLPSKGYISDLLKKIDFDDKLNTLNKKITSNKSKHLLVENELPDKTVKL